MNANEWTFSARREELNDILARAEATGPDGVPLDLEDTLRTLVVWFRTAHHPDGGPPPAAKVVLIGNGGSAAIASHIAFDSWKNGRNCALAFNDSSLLTGGMNDYGADRVFAEALRMHVRKDDAVVIVSSSGASPNVVAAAKMAKAIGCRIATFSAFAPDNPLRSLGELNLYLPTREYGHAENGHQILLHYVLDRHLATREA